jgi:hypothetical protein
MSWEKLNVGGNFVHSEPQEVEPKFPAHWLLEVREPNVHTTIYLVGLIYLISLRIKKRNASTDFSTSHVTRTHVHTHTNTHSRAYAHAHAHACTQRRTHARTRAHAHTHTHSHSHAHARARTHTQARACAHTHTRARARDSKFNHLFTLLGKLTKIHIFFWNPAVSYRVRNKVASILLYAKPVTLCQPVCLI